MYKQYKDFFGQIHNNQIIRLTDNVVIPFEPKNSDYQVFKIDLANTQITNVLSDANNNVMTADQISTFLSTLP